MKKVLVFGITENPGGVESVIMNYYRKINREKIEFDFLCNTKIVAYEEEIKSLGGNIYRIPARRDGRKEFYQALKIFMKEHTGEYDAIWVNVCSLANIDYLIAAKQAGISRRIIHCHNAENGDNFLRGILHRINKIRVKQYATDYWSCSDEASGWFFGNEIKKNPNYRLIYNAIELKKFAQDEQIRKAVRKQLGVEDKIVIGHIGRFHFQKNHIFLTEVFRELKKLDERYELILIGQGELQDEIQNQMKKNGLQDSVQFLGVRSDVAELYQAMDVFVFPSLFEGLPIVLLEAQANGLSCIIAETITEKVKINDNLYFKSLNDSPEEWAIFIDNECKNQIRANQKKFAESPYNIERQVETLEKIF